MKLRTTIVLLALVLALGVGYATSQAGGTHKHRLTMTYKSKPFSLDPNGVNGKLVFCPNGYKATGGAADYDSGATFILADNVDADFYSVIALNESSSSGGMTAKAACLRGATSSTSARQRRASHRAARVAFRSELRRAVRAGRANR